MKTKISKSDFTFVLVSYGRYNVTYQSPVTGKRWTCQTTCSEFIDLQSSRHDGVEPAQNLLNRLKRACKKPDYVIFNGCLIDNTGEQR